MLLFPPSRLPRLSGEIATTVQLSGAGRAVAEFAVPTAYEFRSELDLTSTGRADQWTDARGGGQAFECDACRLRKSEQEKINHAPIFVVYQATSPGSDAGSDGVRTRTNGPPGWDYCPRRRRHLMVSIPIVGLLDDRLHSILVKFRSISLSFRLSVKLA